MLLEDRSYWSKISENSVFFPMRGRRSGKESVFKCLFFKRYVKIKGMLLKWRNLVVVNYIAKVTIYVKNQEEAKLFWTEKMGFVCHEQPMGPHIKWMEVRPNEGEKTSFVIYERDLMLKQNPQANVSHPNIILSTTEIEATYKKMQDKGVTVGPLQVMPYGKMFSFEDQDGNKYLLREDK